MGGSSKVEVADRMREKELGETREDCLFCEMAVALHCLSVEGEESANVWLRAAERSVFPSSPHEKRGVAEEEEGWEEENGDGWW